MIIIITNYFKKDFLKIFQEKDLKIFCKKLFNTEKINLKNPYKKFKFKILNLNIRGVYIVGIKGIYLPIFITKKSNKNYGMNLILTKELVKILQVKYEKNLKDFENGDFEKYNQNGEKV